MAKESSSFFDSDEGKVDAEAQVDEVAVDSSAPEPTEVATPEQPVAEVPVEPSAEAAPAPVPEPEAPPVGAGDTERLRAQVAQQGQEIAQFQQRQAEAEAARQLQGEKTQLEEQGWAPEQAQWAVDRVQRERSASIQMHQQYVAAVEHMQGKMNASTYYASKYGVTPNILMQYESPDQMENAARQTSEMAALIKEVEALKGNKAPEQHLDSGRGRPAASGGTSAQLDRLIESGEWSDEDLRTAGKLVGETG